jgi:hypothetical protein
MKRALLLLAACSAPPAHPVELPAATTICYAGVASGMGQKSRTIARRTVDPAAHQIIEDVTHDQAGAHGAKSFHVVMDITGDHFTMTETGGAFTGSGTLTGEPWQWTSWSSVSQIPNTGIEVTSDDAVSPSEMRSTKQIRQKSELLATTEEVLQPFDCTQWDAEKAALAVPAADEAACDRACRNFATLKFWQANGEQDKNKIAELQRNLDSGLPNCITQCVSANNGAQTACFGAAKSVDELSACL